MIDAEKELKWQIEKMMREHKNELDEAIQENYWVNKYEDLEEELREINRKLADLNQKLSDL